MKFEKYSIEIGDTFYHAEYTVYVTITSIDVQSVCNIRTNALCTVIGDVIQVDTTVTSKGSATFSFEYGYLVDESEDIYYRIIENQTDSIKTAIYYMMTNRIDDEYIDIDTIISKIQRKFRSRMLRRKTRAALTIQWAFKEAISNPSYKMCKNRLRREITEF